MRHSLPDATQLHSSASSGPLDRQCDRIDWLEIRKQLGLTRRQLDVVQLIVEESLTSAAIGQRLFIAERTVTTHITAVHKRLKVHTRPAVVSKVWSTWLQMVSDANAPRSGSG